MREELSLLPDSPDAGRAEVDHDAWTPTDAQRAVGAWFGRKPTTAWSVREQAAWRNIKADALAEGLQVLAQPYKQKVKFTRRDLLTLLNNWTGEIDRWRNLRADPQPQQAKPSDTTNRSTITI